jgi:hypothetical protein
MTILSRTQLTAATTAVCAVGFLTMPASAHARPPIPLAPICDSFVMGPGTFVINQDNNIVVEMDGWDGKTGTGRRIKYHLEHDLFGQPDVTTGIADGAINGNKINFRAHWDPHPGSSQWNEYAGTIGDDGYARGTTRNSGGAVNKWGSVEPLKCAAVSAEAPGKSYSAIAYSMQTLSWATAQDAADEGAAIRAAKNACHFDPSEGNCEYYVAPGEFGVPCVAVAAIKGASVANYGADAQSAEAMALKGAYPGTKGAASVCATGKPAATPVIRTGTFPYTAPSSEIKLRFDPPTLIGIRAWVGITNNAGKPSMNCTFDDGVTPSKPFSVSGDKETPVDLPGIPTGRVYNVVVTCGALTHSEQKQF